MAENLRVEGASEITETIATAILINSLYWPNQGHSRLWHVKSKGPHETTHEKVMSKSEAKSIHAG